MNDIQAPSLDRAALLIRFQRAMSARPSTFLPRGSVFEALAAGAGEPASVWALACGGTAVARTTGAMKRTGAWNRIVSPAGTSRWGCRIYAPDETALGALSSGSADGFGESEPAPPSRAPARRPTPWGMVHDGHVRRGLSLDGTTPA